MIIILTTENFEEEVLKSEKPVLVKFSAKTGCQACIDFKPEYELASQNENFKYCEYESENLSTPADEIQKKYQIRSFPTILLFDNGAVSVVPKYKLVKSRTLAGMILDEQKRLYDKQCFVEDMQLEMMQRQKVEENEK